MIKPKDKNLKPNRSGEMDASLKAPYKEKWKMEIHVTKNKDLETTVTTH